MTDWKEDHLLMNRIAGKDSAALEQLYDRYESQLYTFAYRMVRDEMMAEEVVQELFMRIWNHASRYEEDQGKFTTWMFSIARNIAIDLLRKKKSRMPEPYVEADTLETMADEGQNTETLAEKNLDGKEMRKAITELSGDQREVVELIYFQGYTQQEVSRLREIPLGTVKSRVRLALKQLRGKLDEMRRKGGVTYEKSSR